MPAESPFSIAPMMDWTDRHCRYFHRLLHPTALLYTEMVHANAVRAGDRERLLGFSATEHPVAVQLGGNDPQMLAEAAQICEQFGYDEINLNIGCPSDRVRTGAFGACLMAQPKLVAECIAAMKDAVKVPVTVKTRTGIDDHDSDAYLQEFLGPLIEAGVDRLILHARIAILGGLSPKQNREVPPLNYPRVERMASIFTDLPIIINGGITDKSVALEFAEKFAGVMLGRAAYQNPWLLAQLAHEEGVEAAPENRRVVVAGYIDYAARMLDQNVRLQSMTRHILGLFQGVPGARRWRRHLSENSHLEGAGPELIEEAMLLVDQCQ